MAKNDRVGLLVVLCAAALVLSTWSRPAKAAEASSANFRATSVTLSGGGSVALVNSDSGVTDRAEVTLGQTEPLAVFSSAATSRG